MVSQGFIDKTRSIFRSKSMSLRQSSYNLTKLTLNGIATEIPTWMIFHQSNTVAVKSIMWYMHDWDPGDKNVIHSLLSVFSLLAFIGSGTCTADLTAVIQEPIKIVIVYALVPPDMLMRFQWTSFAKGNTLWSFTQSRLIYRDFNKLQERYFIKKSH